MSWFFLSYLNGQMRTNTYPDLFLFDAGREKIKSIIFLLIIIFLNIQSRRVRLNNFLTRVTKL